MKYLLLVSTLLFSLSTITFAQEYKKATASSFKKQIVGKTFYGKNSLRIKFARDGTFSGELKSSKDGAKRIIKGTWTFNNTKGFCRHLTTINPAKGLIKENGRECQSVLHKGKGVIIVNGATWKTR